MKKLFIFLISISIVIPAVLLAYQWRAWFHNSPEEAYVTPHRQDRIILSFGEDTEHERIISWRCGSTLEEAQAEVVCEKDTCFYSTKGELVRTRAGESTFYQVFLSDLQFNKKYSYRLINGQDTTMWYSFRMPGDEKKLSFLYIGDVQDPEDGELLSQLRKSVQQYTDVNFLVFGGDLIESPTDKYWCNWFRSMQGVPERLPIVAATGNHEYIKGFSHQLDPRWCHTFVNPKNGPQSGKGRSYILNFKELSLIVLDSEQMSGSPASLYSHHFWLKRELEKCHKKWKIVVMHHPIYSATKGRDNTVLRWIFRPLFEKYKVNLVLEGHDHCYYRKITNYPRAGSPVYIVSSCSPKHYRPQKKEDGDYIVSDKDLYQYISVDENKLHLKSIGLDNQIYDDILFSNNKIRYEE